jgi:predicted aspartyl protease
MASGRIATSFDPALDLIFVDASLAGPRGRHTTSVALDTGASMTTVVPDWIDRIGYSVRDGIEITSVMTIRGPKPGFILPVAELTVLGFTLRGFTIHVIDIEMGVQGLIGLDFLRHFNYEVRSAEGRILTRPVTPRRGAMT